MNICAHIDHRRSNMAVAKVRKAA